MLINAQQTITPGSGAATSCGEPVSGAEQAKATPAPAEATSRSRRDQRYWQGGAGWLAAVRTVRTRVRVRELVAARPGGLGPAAHRLGRDRERRPRAVRRDVFAALDYWHAGVA